MKNKLIWSFICLALISCGNSTYEPEVYLSTNLTEEKIVLSKEVFKKLKKEHYIKNFVKDDFNIKYINALIDRLDENKSYFVQSEIDNFSEESKKYAENFFDIDLAYSVINLYFERLVAFSEYQIKLIEKQMLFTKYNSSSLSSPTTTISRFLKLVLLSQNVSIPRIRSPYKFSSFIK